jgi:dCMP deaminase
MELERAYDYLRIAQNNADEYSSDPHTKVGSIILTPDLSKILTSGVNGYPKKLNVNIHERLDKVKKLKYICHSEANAICDAASKGVALKNSVIVITKFPCSTCTKLLIQSGIKKIFTVAPDFESKTWGADARISQEILKESNIEIEILVFEGEYTKNKCCGVIRSCMGKR